MGGAAGSGALDTPPLPVALVLERRRRAPRDGRIRGRKDFAGPMALARRAATASNRHRLFYMWKVLKFFDDFEEHAEELMSLFVSFAFETRNSAMACALRSTCRRGWRIFDEQLKSALVPDLGDGDWPAPLFSRRLEKLAWSFARCHLCMHRQALHRCDGFVRYDNAKECTILSCEECVPRGNALLVQTPVLTASRRVLFSSSAPETIEFAKEVFATCRVTARHVGRHLWAGVVRGKCRVNAVFLTEVFLDRCDGTAPLRLSIPLFKEHHEHAFGRGAIRNSTVQNWNPILLHAMIRYGGHAIVRRVLIWSLNASCRQSERPSRKAKRQKLPSIRCTHRYSKPFRGARLIHCTHCDCDGGCCSSSDLD